jgi:hypothetical protein
MLVRIFIVVTKQLRKTKEGFIWAHSFNSFSPSWQGGQGRALNIMAARRQREKTCTLAGSLLLLFLFYPGHGVMLPTFRADLPPSLEVLSQTHPECALLIS